MAVNRIVERCIHSGNVPAEILPRIPLVELVGFGRVLIEKHRGITEYGQNQICVTVSFGSICIQGCDLELACMTKERIVITGKIDGIQLVRKER